MDFGFDEVQEDVRGLARTILGEQVTVERLREVEAGGDGMDRQLWRQLAEANLLGIALPSSVGGSGYGLIELAVVLEEVGRRVAPVPLLATIAMGAMPIARFGTEEQQARYLPPVVAGSSVLTAALQEPASHDPLTVATRARRRDGGWIVDGTKIAVPWAPLADALVVSADAGLFLVDAGSEGVTMEAARATSRVPHATVVLEDAPCEALGAAGPSAVGWLYEHAVAGLCATGVGVLDEAMRITAAYISERHQFGRPLATFQGATLRLADGYIDTEAVRAAVWSAIWRLAAGRPAGDALAIAKFWVADGGQRVVHACQHLHGGIGVDVDYHLHRYFLWAKELELTLGGATAQLLRLGASMARAGTGA